MTHDWKTKTAIRDGSSTGLQEAMQRAMAPLPPGPYRVIWPSEQGGGFLLVGRQGTPPDYSDGWAIPVIASGTDTAIFALRDILAALRDIEAAPPPLDGLTVERFGDAVMAALRLRLVHGATDALYTPREVAEMARHVMARLVEIEEAARNAVSNAFSAKTMNALDGLREAAQAALDLLPDLSVAYHQVGSLRDHADPKDKTGWNLHGIETCEDIYCLDALETIAALRAALAQQETDHE